MTFAEGLRALRRAAGNLTYRELAAKALCSSSALSNAAAGRELPTLTVTLAYVGACGGDVAKWERRWREARKRPPPAKPGRVRPRRLITAAVLAVVVAVTAFLTFPRNRDPVDLIALAHQVTCRSGHGGVRWGSGTRIQAGPVNLTLQAPTESGVRVGRVLGTHPEWMPGGYLEGDFELPRPIHGGDHLVATVGFFVDEPCFASGTCRVGGIVDFSVYVGEAKVDTVRDVADDWRTPRLDLDLSAYEGHRDLRLRVDAGQTPAQDWAVWWDLRIELTAALLLAALLVAFPPPAGAIAALDRICRLISPSPRATTPDGLIDYMDDSTFSGRGTTTLTSPPISPVTPAARPTPARRARPGTAAESAPRKHAARPRHRAPRPV